MPPKAITKKVNELKKEVAEHEARLVQLELYAAGKGMPLKKRSGIVIPPNVIELIPSYKNIIEQLKEEIAQLEKVS